MDVSHLFNNSSDTAITSSIKYANGFDIYEVNGIKKLVIYSPQKKNEILETFYFADSTNYYKYKPTHNFIKLPMDSVAVFSATQLNAFSKLKILNKVVAISESSYIQNPVIKNMVDREQIVNLASGGNFYVEKTLKLHPRIIFYSPYNIGQKHPLAATNITMIPFFDFTEASPLGRAEWIKFTALFFNKTADANLIFDTIVNNYNYYKKLALEADSKPTVFSDKYYSGQWFMPGGKSYIAQLFKDAGAHYLWKDNSNTGSINLDFEVVYSKAHNADYWRIVGTYPAGFSYDKLGSENNLYNNFKAFKNKNVIFCDSRASSYFETGTLEPQVLLSDLIFVFHPELMKKDYKPKYYNLIKK